MNMTRLLPTVAGMALCLICWGQTKDAETECFTPVAPDYADSTLWVRTMGDVDGCGADVFYILSTWEEDWTTPEGLVCHYADVYNPTHRAHMGIEMNGVAAYMGAENDFYAPFYRHTTMEAWTSRDERVAEQRFAPVAMEDVKAAFEYFTQHRDPDRPLVIAGFSQGAKATVELVKCMDENSYEHLVAAYVLGYKVTPQDTTECKRLRGAQGATDTGVVVCYNTVKDTKYIVDMVASPCAMCINPVNWRTDDVPAVLHDTITVSVDTVHHVLVARNYAAAEYKPYKGFINVGDIHGCEPWLYSECLRRNIRDRVRAWRDRH